MCFLAVATRLLLTNDAVRSCGDDGPGLTKLEFRSAVDSAQAASDAAPRTAASNRTMFRAPAAETEHAFVATCGFLEQAMEDMLQPLHKTPVPCPPHRTLLDKATAYGSVRSAIGRVVL